MMATLRTLRSCMRIQRRTGPLISSSSWCRCLSLTSSPHQIQKNNPQISQGGGYKDNLITRRFFSSDTKPSPIPKETFDKMVKNSKVVIFMKGVPQEPRCGFSNAVVQILRMHGVDKYDAHDVLADEGIRQGIKEYTNWPTVPQIFINGEFVGGCDILIQMHQNGDLIKELEKVGIKSALTAEQGGGNK